MADPWGDKDELRKVKTVQLERELARQAVWVAAVEDGRFPVRDQALSEGFVDGAITLSFDIYADKNSQRVAEILLDGESIASVSLPYPKDGQLVRLLTQALEAAAREHVLERILEQADLPDGVRAAAWQQHGGLAQDAVQHVGRFDLTSQYLLCQKIHEQIRSQGPSPERYRALIRGYANLSFYCQYHLRCLSETFGARAMVYAQRLLVLDPHDHANHWSQVYACAMLDIQRTALNRTNKIL